MAGDFLVVKDCDGDLDGDGFVDFTDVLLLVEGWAGPVTDVDGDGDTGPTDLISMLGMMGSCGDE